MSDEEDYMSDAFLAKCIPEDIRPGLKRVSLYLSFPYLRMFNIKLDYVYDTVPESKQSINLEKCLLGTFLKI